MAGIDHNDGDDHKGGGEQTNGGGDHNAGGGEQISGGGEQISAGGNGQVSSQEPQAWDLADAEPLETERLALNDEDERLPWLESGDDDEADYAGVDSGRMAQFLLAGLVSLAAIVGGIWWVTNRNGDQMAVADGSVIAAPVTPASEKPKDPGGKTFDGTGDTSFAVSEGQSRPAQLGGNAPSAAAKPTPTPSASPSGSPSGKAPPAPTAAAAAPSGVGVQVGAFSSNASAEAAWTKLSQQHSALAGVRHRVVQGSADIGTVYRLQALAGDTAAAKALCGKLKAGGLSCQVK